METKPTMSTEEAAAILQCSENHVNWLCRNKKLKAKKPFGRWIVDSLDVLEKAGLTEEKSEAKEGFDI
jgi:hypothetical protein